MPTPASNLVHATATNMFLMNVLFCMLVFSCSKISSAFTRRSCFDCISILSCESGITFARRLSQGRLPSQSRKTFVDAICGTDSNNPGMPKVCCSAFAMYTETSTEDPIETHPNIGLLPTSCGIIKSGLFHGKIPKPNELPWMTLIADNTTGGVEFRCAGSVINSRYILTAGHCVTNGKKFRNIASVRIGEYDYSTNDDCQGDYENTVCESSIQDIEVEEMIPHENFTMLAPLEGNIALLRLKKAIVMTNNAAPICLPVYSDLRNTRLAGKNAIMAGWGIYLNYNLSTKLMKAWIPILTSDNCTHYYNRFEHQRNSSIEKSFCAGDPLVYSCFRGGGPLIMESNYNNQVRLIQYGIHTAGSRYCDSQNPEFYTDVTKYMDWILDKIRA